MGCVGPFGPQHADACACVWQVAEVQRLADEPAAGLQRTHEVYRKARERAAAPPTTPSAPSAAGEAVDATPDGDAPPTAALPAWPGAWPRANEPAEGGRWFADGGRWSGSHVSDVHILGSTILRG